MNAEQKAPVDGYPQNFGTKHYLVDEFAGPTSYVTGGQTINASDVGMGTFDYFDAGELSYSGTYYFRVQPLPTSPNPSTQKPGITQVKVLWIVAATGLEVGPATNLSGEIARFIALGL